MSAFEYRALDINGKEISGICEAETEKQVRQNLRQQGHAPLAVSPVVDSDHSATAKPSSTRLSATVVSQLTRQLAILLSSGQPMADALGAIARQARQAKTRHIVLSLRSAVTEGQTLAAGLEQFPRSFDHLYRQSVAAGEQAGQLEMVLNRLSDYLESRDEFGRKIMLALIYPAMIALVSVIVVTGLLTFVVPKVISVFSHLGQDLPVLTRNLIATSDWLISNGLILLAGIAIALFAFLYFRRRPGFTRVWHRWILHLPLVGRMSREMNSSRFARTLGILTNSAVPVLQSMKVAGQVMQNQALREAVAEATQAVAEGQSIHAALGHSGHFPAVLLELIASGEKSGQLGVMLEHAADINERQLSASTAAILAMIEPMLILIVGGLVLVIVLAILLPIFQMNQLLV